MTWTVVDWVMVSYLAVGAGIEVWRWPRERQLRADLALQGSAVAGVPAGRCGRMAGEPAYSVPPMTWALQV